MNIDISVPRPLPPACYADEPGDGFDIPVYNRAYRVIGYRQSVRTLRDLGADVVMPMHLDIRAFPPADHPGSRGQPAPVAVAQRLLLLRLAEPVLVANVASLSALRPHPAR